MNSQKLLELSKEILAATEELVEVLEKERIDRTRHTIRNMPFNPDQPIADTVLQLAEHFFGGAGVRRATLLIPEPLLYGLEEELCGHRIRESDELNTPYGLLTIKVNPIRFVIVS